MYEKMTDDTLIAVYKVARLNLREVCRQIGARTIEAYNATTIVLDAGAEVQRREITQEAGMVFANVWE